MQIRAFSKINLILEVMGKRPDGYHNLRSVMQTLALHDTITITSAVPPNHQKQAGFTLTCSDPSLPTDHRNLVTKAATYMMQAYNITNNIHIDLVKHIPQGAGLGGGSSDCGATLTGINELFDLGIPLNGLISIGQRFGADVPFCLQGGTALAEGIGEILTPLPPHPHCWVVLACQRTEVSTGEIFSKWIPEKTPTSNIPAMKKALQNGDLTQITDNFYNDLTSITAKKHNIYDLISEMNSQGAIGAAMSGSGPTVFGYFTDKYTAEKAKRYMEKITGRAIFTEIIPKESLLGGR
ncbi:MAG: 4-(cytidine 5'-diphospho)-2-C-methyl-D-erythritol kinase [Defluviitaleaceae bacterium]|nr:4-(cytidine 5'-diphospho)-2-C-methyl-D-erythritol kinase [Defluviitaleaceae bacterium]